MRAALRGQDQTDLKSETLAAASLEAIRLFRPGGELSEQLSLRQPESFNSFGRLSLRTPGALSSGDELGVLLSKRQRLFRTFEDFR